MSVCVWKLARLSLRLKRTGLLAAAMSPTGSRGQALGACPRLLCSLRTTMSGHADGGEPLAGTGLPDEVRERIKRALKGG